MICTVRFGTPIHAADQDEKAEIIKYLRDTMAALRWDLISCAPLLDRRKLDIPKMRAELWQAVDEYPFLEWEKEERVILTGVKDT